MDSYELNKMIGALLAVVFVVFSVGILSDSIFSSPVPEIAGYAIVAVEPEAEEGGGEEAAAPAAIATLLATADADAGAAVFKKCAACHTPNEGGGNKVGPNLWEIVNRPVAAIEGFGYSAAMREFAKGGAELWTFDHLNGFLLAPKSYIKGTAMSFAGLKKDDERANVIAYLRTLSASPAPVPEAPAPAAENASAPAGDAPVDQAPPAQSLEEGAPAQAAPGAQTPGEEADSDAPGAVPADEAAEAPATEAPAAEAAAPEPPAAGEPAPAPAEAGPAVAPAFPRPSPPPAP